MFFGRNDAKAETPVLWPPHVKSWLIGKDPDAGRGQGQEEKGTTEDEMAGWHHRLNGREFEWTLGVGDGQGGLACCDSWGRKESDTTEWLNWLTEGQTELQSILNNSFLDSSDMDFSYFKTILCLLQGGTNKWTLILLGIRIFFLAEGRYKHGKEEFYNIALELEDKNIN